jgi:protein TonB
MSRWAAPPFAVTIALVLLAGCGVTKTQRTPADLRGDAIRPVDHTPPEGTLSTPTAQSQPERFTLRRSADAPLQRDTVVRVNPPLRIVRAPDTTRAAQARAVTTTPAPATPPTSSSQRTTPSAPSSTSSPPPASGQFLQRDPPVVISRVPAVSPESAREARVGGTVLVKVLVGTDGSVRATRVARSIPELDSAAIACVKQWKFKPAMSSGVPVASWIDVPVRFLLQ